MEEKYELNFRDSFPTEAGLLFGLPAMAFDWAWALLAFSGPYGANVTDAFSDSVFLLSGIGSVSVAFLFYGAFHRQLSSERGNRIMLIVMTLSTTIYIGLTIASFFAPSSLSIALVSWISGGVSTSSILLKIGLYFSTLKKVRAGLTAATALLIAGLIYALVVNNDAAVIEFSKCGLLAMACFLSWSIPMSFASAKKHSSDTSNPFKVVFSEKVPRDTVFYFITMLLYSIAFGYTSAAAGYLDVNQEFIEGRQVVYLAAGVLVTVLVAKFREKLNLSMTQWWLLMFVAVGLLLLPFDSNSLRFFSCMAVLLGFSCYDIVNWLTLSELSHNHNPVMTFGFGRAFLCLGMAIGRVFFVVTVSAFGFSEQLVMAASILIALGLVIGIIIAGIPAFKVYAPEVEYEEDSKTRDGWIEACNQVGKEFGLTPREQEVFHLLAKGRSSSVIQEALCISPHTVKAHTVHIYQKLDVHSRQELITLVDNHVERES